MNYKLMEKFSFKNTKLKIYHANFSARNELKIWILFSPLFRDYIFFYVQYYCLDYTTYLSVETMLIKSSLLSSRSGQWPVFKYFLIISNLWRVSLLTEPKICQGIYRSIYSELFWTKKVGRENLLGIFWNALKEWPIFDSKWPICVIN